MSGQETCEMNLEKSAKIIQREAEDQEGSGRAGRDLRRHAGALLNRLGRASVELRMKCKYCMSRK